MIIPLFASRKRGSALVTVLGMSVIIVVIVVASLSHTANERIGSAASSNMALTHLLADGAADLVIGDLAGEMVAASTMTTGSNGVRVLRSDTSSAMIPVRVLKDSKMAASSDFRNLLKQSVAGEGVFPAAEPYTKNNVKRKLIASGLNTSELSLNGRRLSVKRWNAPLLLGGTGFSAAEQLPDWIFTTRQGPAGTSGSAASSGAVEWSDQFANHQQGNKEYVIGRFAYNIYDVGSLLDINAAGSPSGMPVGDLKSSLAGAVVTNVTGVTDLQKLTGWRNAAAPVDAAAYTTYATQQALRLAFLKAQEGDRRFHSRWDLIQWVKNYQTDTGITLTALPWLTHYTRTLDAPSVTRNPAFDTISTSASGSFPGYDARTVSVYNPDLLATCFPEDVTLSDAAGTKVQAGTPVAFRRFPLRRLALVSATATAVKKDTDDIYRNFGIYRSQASAPWVYDHGAGNRILPLDEVAQAGREPDFFELLQAAIANGSLGASCGNYGDLSQSLLDTDRNFFRHILQIGINAIDQYDADHYPTWLSFRDSSGDQMDLYGIENLPYISAIGTMVYRRASPEDRSTIAAWYQVQLWNPHRNASDTPSADLRVIVQHGQTDLKLFSRNSMRDYKGVQQSDGSWEGGYSNNGYTLGPILYSSKQNFTSNASSLEFSNSATLSSAKTLGPNGTTASDYYPINSASSSSNIVNETASKPSPSTNSFVGIYVGQITGVPDDFMDDPAFGSIDVTSWSKADHKLYGSDTPEPKVWNNACIRPNPGSTASGELYFELQIKIDGSWVTYQKFSPFTGSPESRSWTAANFAYTKPASFASYAAVDPRTQRFSIPLVLGFRPGDCFWRYGTGVTDGPTGSSSISGNTMKSNVSSYFQGVGWPNQFQQVCSTLAYNLEDSFTASPYQTYSNADGVKRQADGNESTSLAAGDRIFPMVGSRPQDRPPILNRPFQTVGELGYVFRDEPWKTLNFFTANSGDSALLDVFCIEENEIMPPTRPVRAGVVNLNTASEEVLTAVLEGLLVPSGTSSADALSHAKAKELASAFVTYRNATPLASKADLVRFLSNAFFASNKYYHKTRQEAFIRAIGDVGDVRAWNLMIDLVAQSGKFPPNSRDFRKFTVEGECHYWVFVSLDRFTGRVIDKKIEIPYE